MHASPEDVYNAITNKVMIEIWSGENAVFEVEPNTEFSLWDGSIVGINLEFVENKMVRQKWFFDEVESEVTIKLHPDKNGTSFELRQNNIPDEAFENIEEGWVEDYIGSLMELFNE